MLSMELLENEAELVKELCRRISAEKERTRKQLKILDMGCGTGKLALYIREVTGCDVTGIDPDRARIEKAKRSFPSGEVTFVVQSAEEMAFANDTFDFVVSLKALHEIPNPREALRQSKRVLKESGELLIIDWIGGVAQAGSHAHAKKYFKQARLEEALTETGFSNVRVEVGGELMLAAAEK
jgi:ubiquinone/menaquinone biosynthesis C-methylase UbiE